MAETLLVNYVPWFCTTGLDLECHIHHNFLRDHLLPFVTYLGTELRFEFHVKSNAINVPILELNPTNQIRKSIILSSFM